MTQFGWTTYKCWCLSYEARTILGLGVSGRRTCIGVGHWHWQDTYDYTELCHFLILLSVSACLRYFYIKLHFLKEIKWNEKRELWYLTKGEVIITIHFKHAFWVWLKLLFANCDFVTLCFVRTKGLCRVNFCLPRTACAFSFPLYPKICLTNGLDGLLQRLLLSSLAHARAPCALYQNILCLNFTLQTCLRL